MHKCPPSSLVLGGGAPIYDRAYSEPSYYKEYKKFNINNIEEPKDLREVATFLFSQPNIASKRWVYEQYDSMVGTNNVSTNHPSDAGVGLIKKEQIKELPCLWIVTLDMFTLILKWGPRLLFQKQQETLLLVEVLLQLLQIVLNFGNPYHPESYWQFVGAIKGMSKACMQYSTPVTGGNVSFYNQSVLDGNEVPVFPTPTIGMIGY